MSTSEAQVARAAQVTAAAIEAAGRVPAMEVAQAVMVALRDGGLLAPLASESHWIAIELVLRRVDSERVLAIESLGRAVADHMRDRDLLRADGPWD